MTDLDQLEKQFRAYVKKMMDFQEAGELINWDMRTGLPKKGVLQRAEVVGTIAAEVFRMSVSPEMENYLAQLSQPDSFAGLDTITQAVVAECKKEFERSKKIPPELFQQFVVLRARSESAWEEAHHEGDFAKFQPYLEQIVSFNQQFIELWGYEGNKYNTLLDYYEPGLTVEQLDPIFTQLRSAIVPLLDAIQSSPYKPSEELFGQAYDVQQQPKFSDFILQRVGFDFAAGRLDISLHPFATGLNRGDVRITTRYDERDFRNSLFSTIHEFGHALYEQNISEQLTGTPLRTGSSMGIHES
ncbi:MAG: carboxypeptidase Taq metallopeptidase family protein, partial [Bacilli bacterium]|nr:carboxypeptidase Taq metallopeptidase family protein [Bacilli bacterium]